MHRIEQYTVEDTSGCLQASPEGVAAFVNARFGFSVHWGIYAVRGEPNGEYRDPMDVFNPVRFDAQQWADLMLEAGQKFLVITAKHGDGFCMFDTQLTDFKVTNTPFGRDPVAELAEALQERGLALHFYYSLLDRAHPAYRNDWPAYVEYYQGQLRELLTNYGEIGGVVFDGYWPSYRLDEDDGCPEPGGEWDLAGTYDLIHKIQPNAVVANNHHVLPLKGEDYQVWELDMPGESTWGCNTTEIGDLPTAAWWNLNVNWLCYQDISDPKPARTVVRELVRALSLDATYLLNVGPTDLGEILPEEQDVLRQVGAWLRTNGQAVYGAHPVGVSVDGACAVQAGEGVYVILTDWPGGELTLEGLGRAFTKARLMDGYEVPLRADGAFVHLTLEPVTASDLPVVVQLS